MRYFDTGATRDTDEGKLDYEGFLSPHVLKRFAEYMHTHRLQADGELRDSDNWQKGIPMEAYMKSLWRHFMDVWSIYRGPFQTPIEEFETALCAMLFNVQGMLHTLILMTPELDDAPGDEETVDLYTEPIHDFCNPYGDGV